MVSFFLKNEPFQICDLSVPSERAPSKLSIIIKIDHQSSSYRANSIVCVLYCSSQNVIIILTDG